MRKTSAAQSESIEQAADIARFPEKNGEDIAEEKKPITDAEIRATLDQLLSEVAEKRKMEKPTLASLLGQYEPIKGHPHFYGRAPKLRQQIEIARLSDATGDDASTATNLESTAALARLSVYKCVEGNMNQVTLDEFLDEFDATETISLLSQFLGLKVQPKEEGADPNAVA